MYPSVSPSLSHSPLVTGRDVVDARHDERNVGAATRHSRLDAAADPDVPRPRYGPPPDACPPPWSRIGGRRPYGMPERSSMLGRDIDVVERLWHARVTLPE